MSLRCRDNQPEENTLYEQTSFALVILHQPFLLLLKPNEIHTQAHTMKLSSNPILALIFSTQSVIFVSGFSCGNPQQPIGGCAKNTTDTVWVVHGRTRPGYFTYDCQKTAVVDAPGHLKPFYCCCNQNGIPNTIGVSKKSDRKSFDSLCTSFDYYDENPPL
ncbi:hypothetical protein MJO29_005048 [Puccinia striiformis f. sp. tritici]|nr:hypothetical protein MJO29_005048 [Puccinia striiformis f. sp. tritici]